MFFTQLIKEVNEGTNSCDMNNFIINNHQEHTFLLVTPLVLKHGQIHRNMVVKSIKNTVIKIVTKCISFLKANINDMIMK